MLLLPDSFFRGLSKVDFSLYSPRRWVGGLIILMAHVGPLARTYVYVGPDGPKNSLALQKGKKLSDSIYWPK
jgi:hypothetical protein